MFEYFNLKEFFLVVLINLLFISCIDPCKNKDCGNGYCIEGDCFCQEGYSGDNCEVMESDKFAGSYIGRQIWKEGTQAIKLKINNFNEEPRRISLILDNYSVAVNLQGNIRNDSIFIPNQWIQAKTGNTIITNLLRLSKGKIWKDSTLNFEMIFYNIEEDLSDTCIIDVKKN
jgi:hypothetical protein